IAFGALLCSSLSAANITVDNPSGYDGNVTLQSFYEVGGNYSATDFNNDSGSILIDFDSAGFTTGDSVTGVIFDSDNGPFNFRANFELNGGGYGRILVNSSTYYSSASQAVVWANGTGAAIILPEFITGSILSETAYSVGFTLTRLAESATVKFYSDTAGTMQLGDTISMTANSSDSGYSFVGYTGTEAIRRVEVISGGSQFGIDDFVVSTTSAIPEVSQSSLYLAGAALLMAFSRLRRRR
ncbi:MAG: hypothetical protein ACQKBT_03935, partial [Puniceicoccales bacterium]